MLIEIIESNFVAALVTILSVTGGSLISIIAVSVKYYKAKNTLKSIESDIVEAYQNTLSIASNLQKENTSLKGKLEQLLLPYHTNEKARSEALVRLLHKSDGISDYTFLQTSEITLLNGRSEDHACLRNLSLGLSATLIQNNNFYARLVICLDIYHSLNQIFYSLPNETTEDRALRQEKSASQNTIEQIRDREKFCISMARKGIESGHINVADISIGSMFLCEMYYRFCKEPSKDALMRNNISIRRILFNEAIEKCGNESSLSDRAVRFFPLSSTHFIVESSNHGDATPEAITELQRNGDAISSFLGHHGFGSGWKNTANKIVRSSVG